MVSVLSVPQEKTERGESPEAWDPSVKQVCRDLTEHLDSTETLVLVGLLERVEGPVKTASLELKDQKAKPEIKEQLVFAEKLVSRDQKAKMGLLDLLV